jgi:uncharacterized membrane protein
MIQRKQTLYLLIAALLTGVLFVMPLARFVGAEGSFLLNMRGIWIQMGVNEQSLALTTYPLMILVILSTLVSLTAVGLYKKRLLQIRLCGINLALQAGLTGFIFYYGQTTAKVLKATVSYEWGVVFPLIALVLTILAFIAIGKDEALVRSVNRIR